MSLRWAKFLTRKPRGQALAETTLLIVLLFSFSMSFMYFFPDSLNALQVYMDGFYYLFSLPVP